MTRSTPSGSTTQHGGPLPRPTAAPHKSAELYQLPDKFDNMSKWEYGKRRGEGTAAEHLTVAWTQESTRLASKIREVSGGKAEIVVSFPAYLLEFVVTGELLALLYFR